MLSCIGSCLKYTKDKLSSEHWKSKEEMRVLIKTLKADIVNMSEQHLFQELRKVRVLVAFFFVYLQTFHFEAFLCYGILFLYFSFNKIELVLYHVNFIR